MILLEKEFAVSPEVIYEAWLDGEKHAAMTGAAATGSAEEGSVFTAWDGYISGKNRTLIPNTKIVQAWRTTEFPDDAPDSTLTIELSESVTGTLLKLTHEGTPQDQEANYEQGWNDHYFIPMQEYFVK